MIMATIALSADLAFFGIFFIIGFRLPKQLPSIPKPKSTGRLMAVYLAVNAAGLFSLLY
jgi:hypothetical protein